MEAYQIILEVHAMMIIRGMCYCGCRIVSLSAT